MPIRFEVEAFSHRAFLLKAQNPDGGWGYFPGKPSWLEPTAWAALALHGDPAAERAYKLIRGWQNSDGSARPCANVDSPHWATALIVILAALRGDKPPVERGVAYLMDTIGSESGPFMRVLHFLSPQSNDREPKFEGWPWRAGAAAWIEPTAHSVTALRIARRMVARDPRIAARIASAQNLIWHQRCRDGGWNYGARVAREVSLQAFPETTALALIGLVGRKGASEAVELARPMVKGDLSPLARAWFNLSLRLHGKDAPERKPAHTRDLLICAINELSAPSGNWRILKERSA